MRQIALDTETTGLEIRQGHRIIEIGGVEIQSRRLTGRTYHCYLQPDREVEKEALAVHGITDDFLKNQPRFSEIVAEFMEFIHDAELVIHNAAFDIGFINYELKLLQQDWRPLSHDTPIFDTLEFARKRHPGLRNSLDALCKRYAIANTRRQLHGALLDAELLAEVYLAMTGGQVVLSLENDTLQTGTAVIRRLAADRPPLPLLVPSPEEQQAHVQRLTAINKKSGGRCLWLNLEKTG